MLTNVTSWLLVVPLVTLSVSAQPIELIKELRTPGEFLSKVTVSPDSKTIAVVTGYELRIFGSATDDPRIADLEYLTMWASFTQDGKSLLLGRGDGTVLLLDPKSGTIQAQAKLFPPTKTKLPWIVEAGDSSVLIMNNDVISQITVVDNQLRHEKLTQCPQSTLASHVAGKLLTCIRLSNDSDSIVICQGDKTIAILPFVGRGDVFELESISSLAVGGGNILVVTSHRAYLIDINAGRTVKLLTAKSRTSSIVAGYFNSDGKRIIIIEQDETAKSAKCHFIPIGQPEKIVTTSLQRGVNSVAINLTSLVTSGDNLTKIWKLVDK